MSYNQQTNTRDSAENLYEIEPPVEPGRHNDMPKVRKKNSIKIKLILFLLFIGIGLAAIFGYSALSAYQQNKEFTNQIPQEIRQKSAFPLYLPKTLPEGFYFDKKTVSGTDQAVIFSLKYDGDKVLTFSQQAIPVQLDIDDFHAKRFVEPQNYFKGDYKMVIGTLNNVKTASLYTDSTWILVTSQNNIETEKLLEILGSLEKID